MWATAAAHWMLKYMNKCRNRGIVFLVSSHDLASFYRSGMSRFLRRDDVRQGQSVFTSDLKAQCHPFLPSGCTLLLALSKRLKKTRLAPIGAHVVLCCVVFFPLILRFMTA